MATHVPCGWSCDHDAGTTAAGRGWRAVTPVVAEAAVAVCPAWSDDYSHPATRRLRCPWLGSHDGRGDFDAAGGRRLLHRPARRPRLRRPVRRWDATRPRLLAPHRDGAAP